MPNKDEFFPLVSIDKIPSVPSHTELFIETTSFTFETNGYIKKKKNGRKQKNSQKGKNDIKKTDQETYLFSVCKYTIGFL